MKVTVFGANGPTGRLLTCRLLDAGHNVIAVTRHPTEFPVSNSGLSVAEADVFNAQAVTEAVAGTDAVISTLGVPHTFEPVDTYSTGTANIVTAMHRNDIRRLIVVSSSAVEKYRNRRDAPLLLRISEPIISRTLGKTVYDDLRRAEALVREGDLDWTIVRPSILFDLDHVTDYTAGMVPPVGGFTARTDLAHYLGRLIDDATSIGTTPIVSTTEGAPTFVEYLKHQASSPAAS
jgi:nucleoside-diphosphate-sugar epimerase